MRRTVSYLSLVEVFNVWVSLSRKSNPSEPDRSTCEQPPESSHVVRYCLILRKQTPRRQQEGPVVLASADERQLLRSGIGDVARDVPEILSYPPQCYACRVPIFSEPEVDNEREREHELEQCAAQRREDFTAPCEDDVASLVNGEVDGVRPMKSIRREPAP